jgi:hypothetical protein
VDQVYVRPFSLDAAGTAVEASGKWQVSSGFGQSPHWRGDGRELYIHFHGGELMAAEITTTPAFRSGSPQHLGIFTFSGWDVTADGKRFLIRANPSGAQPENVVLNWQSGLKK